MLQAVIFDFDGVIVDTEHLHYEALNRVLEPMGMGFSWEAYVRDLIGFDDRGAFLAVMKRHRRPYADAEIKSLVERKAVTFNYMVRQEPPDPFPGAVELIRHLAGRIPLGLCSGALRSDIEPIFEGLQLADAFDVMVTADDVRASKPDPSCYRLAVKRLAEKHGIALRPAQCLAIEDTPAGITSAKGAKLKVLGLTNSYDREYLGLADYVRDTLMGLDLEELRRMMK
ncbi:MAG TPA: HAD family phosphatase [Kiritimatiellia bacterium]|nr:HAD family phosphatase [Kiritimatiellia bacterium]